MPSANVIDGKAIADGLLARVGREVTYLKATQSLVPGLAVVLVGKDPASQVYVKAKAKRAADAGLKVMDCALPETASEAEVMQLVGRLNDDASVHGILVQLPLPRHIRADRILHLIKPGKDVDGFHPTNAGLLSQGQRDLGFVPCTPLGCLMLLKSCVSSIAGKRAVVVGRSNIVGKPMAQLLLNADCTVTTVHSKTLDLAAECRRADILIAAIGRAEFVKAAWIKPGAIVIDVGINRQQGADGQTRLVGDIAFVEAKQVAGWITPVPGGVGPMTIACLLANTVTAACRANDMECSDWLGGQDTVTQIMPAFARVP
jgi:methylenetetrahydrofolate dehydrogenase (NADP+) / methenyltetrahydrofolate cyclohydrolase